ncbi:MAG TPA: glycoside hydrolase [Candidatus Dormibacteraeota bacterium]|jgi:alpha-amylase
MPNALVIYMVAHQPRRVRLPAQMIPRGTAPERMDALIFDDQMDRRYFDKVATYCYRPATELFQSLVEGGMKISLGFSVSLLLQMRRFGPDVLRLFQKLVSHENVELVAVEPYHSFIFYLDIAAFAERMQWGKRQLEETFQKPISVTDTTEMFMSNDIYFQLQASGFKGAVMDGRPWVMGWREPSHLYRYPGEQMRLFTRHFQLSDDVGYRFSNREWNGWPLMADTYAGWVRQSMGDFTFLAWDYETFGEHHRSDSGIFPFMHALHADFKQHKMNYLMPSEAIAAFTDAHEMPLPEYGCTWAGDGGMDFFLGNEAQQGIFRLMHHIYNKAKLTKHPHLMDIAMWLLQSDNLHLIQWFSKSGSQAEVSAYFTPDEWWELGPLGILREQQRVYVNFLRAMDEYA